MDKKRSKRNKKNMATEWFVSLGDEKVKTFDGKLKYKLNRPNGTIMHSEIIIKDSVIMVGESLKEYGSIPASIYLYVPDCDAIYAKQFKMEQCR